MAKSKIPQHIRLTVARRANWICEYCKSQERFATQEFSLDHIDPESKGGYHSLDNLAYSCQGCNGYKSNQTGALDPLTHEFSKFFHPRIHAWDEHFAWDDNCTQMVGLSAEGRTTIDALRLNRKILIGLRTFLHKYGEHPPAILS